MKSKLAINNTVHPQTVEVPLPLEVHPSVSPLAAELLMKTYETIVREPKLYHQGVRYVKEDCASPCCILGHMSVAKNGRHAHGVYTWSGAGLGLTHEQTTAIYTSTIWPAPFTQKNSCELCPVEIGLARIEHFLRTGE